VYSYVNISPVTWRHRSNWNSEVNTVTWKWACLPQGWRVGSPGKGGGRGGGCELPWW